MKVFSLDTLDYLRQVHLHNSREWFAEHKEWYTEALIAPLQEFVQYLSKTMSDIDEEFELTPRVNKTISRINRDTRFSKDKSLYKEKMWVTFKKIGKDKIDYPAYFFELGPQGYRYGMGFFNASPKSMGLLREQMTAKEKQFSKLVKAVEEKEIFSIEGEMYKRNQFSDKKLELQQWYNRKNIYLTYNSEIVDELFQDVFMENVKEDFTFLADLYHFFVEAMVKEN